MFKSLVREDELKKDLSRIAGSSRVKKLNDNDDKKDSTGGLYENLIIL